MVPDKKPAFRHNFLKFKDGFKMLIWCNSCDKCKGRNGWKGYSEYSTATRQISRKYTPITEHGDFHATKRWNPWTSKTENELKEFVANNAHFTTQDLVKIVEKHQPGRPSDDWLRTWGKNHRVHKGTPIAIDAPPMHVSKSRSRLETGRTGLWFDRGNGRCAKCFENSFRHI